jgi:hypothetical protein
MNSGPSPFEPDTARKDSGARRKPCDRNAPVLVGAGTNKFNKLAHFFGANPGLWLRVSKWLPGSGSQVTRRAPPSGVASNVLEALFSAPESPVMSLPRLKPEMSLER